MVKKQDRLIEKRASYILIILQKSCQNNNSLIMNEKTILGGAKKCANTHKSVRYRTLSTTDLAKICLVGKMMF